jgi:NADH dehydrogenase
VEVAPLAFADPARLVRDLHGAATLYNTYWIRFPYGNQTYDTAVENTKILLRAAEAAGVRKLVHISITNASVASPLSYFRGKGALEDWIRGGRVPSAIVRPSVVFGPEDVLINNIAWCLCRFPVFAVPGRGDYRIQPIFVEDLAEIAVTAGQGEGNTIVDAVGPEVYSFEELTRLIAARIGSRARVVHLPPRLALWLSRVIGYGVKDQVLTWDEVAGLMANTLVSASPPTGKTRLSDWLAANAQQVGARYASELARHYR